MPNGDNIGIKTPWFGITAGGSNSAFVIVVLAIMALSGLTLWEHFERQREHQDLAIQTTNQFYQLQCTMRLSIYIYTRPKGAAIDWNHMPSDLYYCVPKFLYER